MKWKLEKLYPSIYHLSFKSHYDLGMHFVRYQEFYEGPSHRGQIFSLLDYMEWYATNHSTLTYKKKTSKAFTYPGDWDGFNLPSSVFDRLTPSVIPDYNKYDEFMRAIALLCTSLEKKSGPWYLIGTSEESNKGCLDHEIAHGLYYTNIHYRDTAQEMVFDLPDNVRGKLRGWLEDEGYCEEVMIDECNAYLSTGLPEDLHKDAACKKARRPFTREFKKVKKLLDES